MAMLNELRDIHEELLAALAALDMLTGRESPDEAAVAAARVRLGRASSRRRRLFDAACNRLMENASPADAQKIREVRELNAAQLQASTAHIGTWSLREIVADWPGYCRTARGMRQSMRDLIAADRETLFPLLGSATP